LGDVPRPGTGTVIGSVPTTEVVRATAALVTRSVTPRTGARARGAKGLEVAALVNAGGTPVDALVAGDLVDAAAPVTEAVSGAG
jgi:hypothetical protein